MIVLIGSAALKVRGIDTDRKSHDIDIVATYDDIVDFSKQFKFTAFYPIDDGKKIIIKTDTKIVEAEVAWPGTVAEELMKVVKNDPETVHHGYLQIPSLNFLYMLKMSHRFLRNSPHFLKTMDDILLMRENGAHINAEHAYFYQNRMAETYNYAHPKLGVSKKSFFAGDGIDYKWDHDSIHEAVKHMDRPAYMYFKPENSDVLCDRDMWDASPEHVKRYAVLEESLVLAAERSQLPFPGKCSPEKSFEMALMKVCTSITSGWFREYAYENYHRVMFLYTNVGFDYMERIKDGIKSGIVKPFDSTKEGY